MAPDRAGAPARAWQRMLSGRRLDLLDPSPFDIEIEDIAHGLAFVARWNGQTVGDFPFSVAEHSLLVEQIFAIPGLGQVGVQATTNGDVPLVMGLVLVTAALVVIVNLAIDLLQGWLNPKVRL